MSQSRREFLRSACGGAALLALAPAAPNIFCRAAMAKDVSASQTDHVLVVIQLSGGNDGLNTVIPYEDDQYGKSRRTLRISGNKVHKIEGSSLGFHPEMHGFSRLFKEGRLSVMQGVAYPNSDRDHNAALLHWHTARPEEPHCQTGWVGRAIDNIHSPQIGTVPGVFVGAIPRPFGLNAEKAVVPSIRSADQWKLHTVSQAADGGQSHRERQEELSEDLPADPVNPLLGFARKASAAAYADHRKIEAVLRGAAGGAEYPNFQLARLLKSVSQLIRADVGVRVFFTELGGGGIGGFDNHANQRDNHAALLRQLSESVAAFIEDLARDKSLDRVLLMTFSEFGRTLAENGRRGTGHGAAAPMFLAGGRLKGGIVGQHPDLADLDNGAPRFHTDFRRVYATALENWLGLNSQAVLGEKYEPLDVFMA